MHKLGANSATAYKIAIGLITLMPLVIALLAWLNGLTGKELWLANRTLIFAVIQRLQEVSGFLYLVSWGVFAWAFYYKKLGDPWLVEQLQFIFDKYQEKAFNHAKLPANTPIGHNRVTLFKYRRGFIRH